MEKKPSLLSQNKVPAFAVGLSAVIYILILLVYSDSTVQTFRLTQIFALLAFLSLYMSILADSFTSAFKSFRYNGQYKRAKNGLVRSALYFGLFHACLAFFKQLGGIEGLGFLSSKYLIAISLSSSALFLIFIVVILSFEPVAKRYTIFRKFFPSWVLYIAGILILAHAVMLGTHFVKLWSLIPQVTFLLVFFLLALELLRLDNFMQSKLPSFGKVSIITVPLFILLLGGAYYYLSQNGGSDTASSSPFGIHAEHQRIAEEAQKRVNPNFSGMEGDATKRYTLDLEIPDNISSGADVILEFSVFDAANGNRVTSFRKVNGQVVHMIVVDKALDYFNHIHPELIDGKFVITTQFPKDGEYHIYLDFQPIGAIEQQIGTSIAVGSRDADESMDAKHDTSAIKEFGNYQVLIDHPKPLLASEMSLGKQILSFNIRDAKTQDPINTLKPYLDAFGHLVMINTETFDYVHAHPNDPEVPGADDTGGPTVEFLPLGLYGPIKPGTYRIFAQFNPDGDLFTSDFTIEIK